MASIRVLVVDDSVVIRRLITSMIENDPHLELAGVAANGVIALQKIPQVNPDIVTLDIEMPEMDGIATLRALRKTYPRLPVVMCSTLTARGAAAAIEALGAGATDYVTKPSHMGNAIEGIQFMERELGPKLKAICARLLPADTLAQLRPGTEKGVIRPSRPNPSAGIDCVAIGTSTGGPNALHDVFANMPSALPVPVFIVQHMPPLFTAMLAERLAKHGRMPVHEAVDGMPVEAGHAYLAPGGMHMVVRRDGARIVVRLNEDPPENSCRPAVDPMFRSLPAIYGGGILAVVMTGMGQDGLRGCEAIRAGGGTVLVQDEASSVVWGMPGYVAQAGLADGVFSLMELPIEIHRRVCAPRRRAA
jgi:two-component system chemotaxis response regulator CheB